MLGTLTRPGSTFASRALPGAILGALVALLALAPAPSSQAQVAVHGKKVYTLAGAPIEDGVVLVRDGKVAAVGRAADVRVPEGFETLEAAVVTPGLIDAHTVVGVAGHLNYNHDQDQHEPTSPIQPELRTLDAYNPRELLVEWVRSFGVTTMNTGPAPGQLISSQTLIVKTAGNSVEEALVRAPGVLAASLAETAMKSGSESPGTRGKMMALLRARFIQAQAYRDRARSEDPAKRPARDLGMEAMVDVLEGKLSLLVTAQRAQDIANAMRLADEFGLHIILDGAAEAGLVLERVVKAGVPVILHPPMARANGELENSSFETAAILRKAGVRVAFQSGFESYVPKTRVVLFEAALAVANGLPFEDALAAMTIEPARILGIDSRVGSLELGKDGDLALYDGDPFEYTSHCVGVVIEGKVVSREAR